MLLQVQLLHVSPFPHLLTLIASLGLLGTQALKSKSRAKEGLFLLLGIFICVV